MQAALIDVKRTKKINHTWSNSRGGQTCRRYLKKRSPRLKKCLKNQFKKKKLNLLGILLLNFCDNRAIIHRSHRAFSSFTQQHVSFTLCLLIPSSHSQKKEKSSKYEAYCLKLHVTNQIEYLHAYIMAYDMNNLFDLCWSAYKIYVCHMFCTGFF